jgi:hypothetical protein
MITMSRFVVPMSTKPWTVSIFFRHPIFWPWGINYFLICWHGNNKSTHSNHFSIVSKFLQLIPAGLFLHSFDDIFSYIRLSFFLTFHDGKIGFRSERNGQYFYRTSKDHNWKRSVKMSKGGLINTSRTYLKWNAINVIRSGTYRRL